MNSTEIFKEYTDKGFEMTGTEGLIEHLLKRAYEVGTNGDLITDDLLEEAARSISMYESKCQMQTALLQQFIIEAGQLRSTLDFLQRHPCWIGRTLEGDTTLECVLPTGNCRIIAKNILEAVKAMKEG